MSVVKENGYPTTSIVNKGKSYANDPYVVRKVAQAKEKMSQVRLPDALKK